MCLFPRIKFHPYCAHYLSTADEIYCLGVSTTAHDLVAKGIPFILECIKDSNGNITKEAILHCIDSTFCLCHGKRHPLLIQLRCGRCIECSNQYRKDIVSRCIIEAAHSPHVFFYTLTYDDDHVPFDGLHKEHISQSFKRFREQFSRYILNGRRLDFTQIYVGEYGTDIRYSKRPHYHGLLFIHDKLSDSEIESLFDFFRPRSIPDSFSDYYRERFPISSFYSSDSHSGLSHWWPYGIKFDLQAPTKGVVPLAKYVSKYITKQFIPADLKTRIYDESVHYPCPPVDSLKLRYNPISVDSVGNIIRYRVDESDCRECHRNPCFVQLPKRIGLACAYIDEYKDTILKGDLITMYVNVYGKLHRIKIPNIYIKKLFPSISDICPCISFYYKLFDVSLRQLESRYNRIDKLTQNSLFTLDPDCPYVNIVSFLKPNIEFLRSQCDMRSFYNNLSVDSKHQSLLYFLESLNNSLSLRELYEFVQCLFVKHISKSPLYDEFSSLISSKLDFYSKLRLPNFSYEKLCEIELIKSKYEFYSARTASYSPFDQFR